MISILEDYLNVENIHYFSDFRFAIFHTLTCL